jgi:hypothetical protein
MAAACSAQNAGAINSLVVVVVAVAVLVAKRPQLQQEVEAAAQTI